MQMTYNGYKCASNSDDMLEKMTEAHSTAFSHCITCTIEASSIESKAWITGTCKTARSISTLTIAADTWYLCTLIDIWKNNVDINELFSNELIIKHIFHNYNP